MNLHNLDFSHYCSFILNSIILSSDLYLFFFIVFCSLPFLLFCFFVFFFFLLLQVKAVSINPLRPEYMAIAANDPLIRVYDRRMLSLRTNQPQRNVFSSSSSSSLSPHHRPGANSSETPPTSTGRVQLGFSAEEARGRRDLRESMPCDVFLPSTFWSVPFEYTPEWQSRFSRLLASTHCW